MSFHSRKPIRTWYVWCFHVTLALPGEHGGLELPWKTMLHIKPARYCPTRFRMRARHSQLFRHQDLCLGYAWVITRVLSTGRGGGYLPFLGGPPAVGRAWRWRTKPWVLLADLGFKLLIGAQVKMKVQFYCVGEVTLGEEI